MTRGCGACGSAGRISRHDRGITTVWCTTWGEVRRGDDPGCRFYVRGPATRMSEFDVNENLAVLDKRAAGKMPQFNTPHRAPKPINVTKLRGRVVA